jgi:metallo-beta-lactamase family protein
MTNLQFLGATDCVTGSKCLLSTSGSQVLMDCGLFQGPRELKERNWLPQTYPGLDAVVLTHAHLDHTGYVPRLVRDGFAGPVYGTRGTVDLLGLLWPDSGFLQEEEARHARKKGYSRHAEPAPLYTESDAQHALGQLRALPYRQVQQIAPGISLSFTPAGHIIGAASATVVCEGKTFVFSGDVGRFQSVYMKPPVFVEHADVLVVESTYGDRLHAKTDPVETLGRIVRDAVARGGMLVVPSFAVGRTQELLLMLRQLEDAGEIPSLEVFVDSPMAVDATEIALSHLEDLTAPAQEMAARGALMPLRTHLVRDVAGSQAINTVKGPGIILSASGMATGGRIKHHLHQRLPDERNTICLAGFQAQGTRGRALQEGAKQVWLFGDHISVRAHVTHVDGLSAHADRNELLTWLRGFKTPPKETFIVHGEPIARVALAQAIRDQLGWKTLLPELGNHYTLGEKSASKADLRQ